MYRYEDLSNVQFEELVVMLCGSLLGEGVKGFAAGPDGGRDAKFMGVAALIPSASAPWSGTVIVQAKHTNAHNSHFSETDFYTGKPEKGLVGEEIVRINKLRDRKQIDHYMLFANRKLTANTDQRITDHIASETGMPHASIMLCGIEQIERWMKRFPHVAKMARLDPVDSPLIVSPDELAEVVEAISLNLEGCAALVESHPVQRIPFERKNEINRMSPEYAKHQRSLYLKETGTIRSFLAAPENEALRESYELAVAEFQSKIIAKRKDYHSFDDVMNYLLDLLFNRDPVLSRYKRLTRAMVFYMYWNCDIGSEEHASPL